jgi:hypothetical protein
MTPNELLEKIKEVVTPQLLITDEKLLNGLLSQSLRKFGAEVGSIIEVRLNELDTDPAYPWVRSEEIHQITDKDGDLLDFDLDGGALTVDYDDMSVFPLRAYYILDYNGIDFDNDEVPSDAFQFVFEYTNILIDIVNIQYVRDAYESSQLSTEGLPLVADIRAAKDAMDTALVERVLVLPPVMVIN